MLANSRIRAALLAACVGVTACAGADSDRAEPDPGASAVTATPEQSDPAATLDVESETAEATDDFGTGAPVRRELGLALRPESDVPTNLLPPIEVHDVGQDRMVNFKNIFPAERPVLLWMWAPY